MFSCKLLKVTCSQKFAFAQRSGAMKAPVGLLSDRTVLHSKMEGPCPDKFAFAQCIGNVITVSAGNAGGTKHFPGCADSLRAALERTAARPLFYCLFAAENVRIWPPSKALFGAIRHKQGTF